MEAKEVKLGSRFVCEGNVGTVRFVGSVPPTEGLWFGVEWDDETRGKHDGSYGGCKYFKTSYPKSGSFIRPSKADFGISCFQAISDRYGKMKPRINADENLEDKLFIVQKNNSILPIEAVGIDKIEARQSKLSNLQDVSISSMKVNGAGPENELANAVPNVIDLDLSQNLITSWEELARITRQLPCLRSLVLSNNRLTQPDNPEILQAAFASLERLILANVNLTWNQVIVCSKMWPQVTHLQVPFNKISLLELPSDALKNVEHLDLEGNSIGNWKDVLVLGYLPRLRFLNLNCNAIEEVYFDEPTPDGRKTSLFPALEALYLQDNKIDNLSSINELNKLGSLSEIMIKMNPIWKLDKPNTIWQLIIAKISGLKLLNRSTISAGERRGAELDYLLKYGKEWLAVEKDGQSGTRDEFIKHHPRYFELVKVHGGIEESEVNVKAPSLKNSLLTLTLHCPQLEESKPIVKKLPESMTVQKFRSLIHRLFKFEMENVVLSCTSKKRPDHEVEMDNDLRHLSFYIESGDEVLIKW